jgi:hypothetical protein
MKLNLQDIIEVDNGTCLRLVDKCDVEPLFNLIEKNRDHLWPWMDWVEFTTSISDISKFVDDSNVKLKESTGCVFVILHNRTIVGTIGCPRINLRVPSSHPVEGA